MDLYIRVIVWILVALMFVLIDRRLLKGGENWVWAVLLGSAFVAIIFTHHIPHLLTKQLVEDALIVTIAVSTVTLLTNRRLAKINAKI